MTRAPALRAVAAVVVAAGVLLAANATASAHARVKESSPAMGEVVATSPAQVSITYSQDIQKITGSYSIVVRDESEADVTAAAAIVNEADRANVTVALRPSLPAGRYVVAYTNVSDEDGDPFEGAFAFYVGREPTAAELAEDAQLPGNEEQETPAATSSPPATGTAAVSPAATATAAPDEGDGEDDGGGGLAIALIVVAAVVVVAAGGGAYYFLRGRGS